jgi:hypothetical protein
MSANSFESDSSCVSIEWFAPKQNANTIKLDMCSIAKLAEKVRATA